MEQRKSSSLWETVRTVLFAVLIALVVRTMAYEPFSIPSGSMIPNLLVGDYLFVSKFSYGYSHHSLPLSIPLFPGRVLYDPPERGDVAVFKKPIKRAGEGHQDYIKRIIGLPGDRIQMVGGRLYINEQVVKRQRIDDFTYPDGPRRRAAVRYLETLPNGASYEIIEERSDRGDYDDTEVYVVPDDHFMVLGDNRDNSQDSRVQRVVGFIPKENLVGRAEFLFFSVRCYTGGNRQFCESSWWEFWNWIGAIRWNRIFTGIR